MTKSPDAIEDEAWMQAFASGLLKGTKSDTERQIQVARERVDVYNRRVADLLLRADKLPVNDLKRVAAIGELLALRPISNQATRDLEYLLRLDRTPIMDMARA